MKKFTLILSMALLLGSAASAQIALRGTPTSATSANATLTINKPTGVVAGDVMIVNIAMSDDNDAVDTNPALAGWTLITGADLQGGTERWGALLYKVAGGSEPASYTFALDAQATGSIGTIVAYSGVSATGVNASGGAGGPFDVDPGNLNVTNAATASAPAISTVTANAAVIMFANVAGSASAYSNWNVGGGRTELYDNTTTTGEDASVGATWFIKAATGTTGAGSVTLTPDERSGALIIALRPGNAVPPPAPSLWATSSDGTQVSSFTVSGGSYIAGPTNIFAPTGGSTAALGRNDQPSAALGYFYWLPNSGTNGVVNVYAATSTGATPTNIATFDVNGASNATLGFVRLGMGPDGTGWILAGDGTTLYLARFTSNGVNPVAVTVEDASVTLVGGSAATFQNGDICVSGNGRIYALANDGSGVTQIFIGNPTGATTTLTKRWDLVDPLNVPFTGSVNGVAFDLDGSLYVSTATGLFFIDDNTVDGPAGTVQCSLVTLITGLQDLASNVFPNETTLPVRLNSFTGSLRNDITTLNWDASSETNFSHYEVERSSNGSSFTKIGSKNSAGSAGRNAYQFSDNLSAVSGNVFYYRLKIVDLDGRSEYSSVIMVRKDQKTLSGLTVNPNPVVGGLATVRFNASASSIATVRVIDMTGKVVLQQQNKVAEGVNSIPVNNASQLQKGTYILQVLNGEELTATKFSVVR
jgi:hypothetical protein